jgi:hypothetical protein
MEAWLWPNGESYGRSTTRDCQYVDGNGDLLTRQPDGTPICYDEQMMVIDCDDPGARRPE